MLTTEHTRGPMALDEPRIASHTFKAQFSASLLLIVIVFGALSLVPLISHVLGHTYYLDVVSRMMILGLAAVGLNIILGYGGMVSFGHALYLGIGAYAVGILSEHGVHSAFVHLVTAIAIGTVIA